MSSVFSFMSHPGTALVPGWTMAIVGDVGQTNNSASTLAHIAASASNMVMHLGDISYADSVEPRWDSWGVQTQFLSAVLPYMVQVCVGMRRAGAAAACPFLTPPSPLFATPPHHPTPCTPRSGNHENELVRCAGGRPRPARRPLKRGPPAQR